MFVSDYMTKKVISASPNDFINQALVLMKENRIKHLPLLEANKLVGIVSFNDIKDYTPSKATSLDIYEIHYILSKITLKEISIKNVITIAPDSPIEEAGLIMFDNVIGCLPVLENEKLVGIISDRDIFKLLIDITGVKHKGLRIYALIPDKPGTIGEIANIIRQYDVKINAIFTSYENVPEGFRNVIVRCGQINNIKNLEKQLKILHQGVIIQNFS